MPLLLVLLVIQSLLVLWPATVFLPPCPEPPLHRPTSVGLGVQGSGSSDVWYSDENDDNDDTSNSNSNDNNTNETNNTNHAKNTNATNNATTSFAAVFRTKIPHVYGIDSVRISFPRSEVPPTIGDSPDIFDPRIFGWRMMS